MCDMLIIFKCCKQDYGNYYGIDIVCATEAIHYVSYELSL